MNIDLISKTIINGDSLGRVDPSYKNMSRPINVIFDDMVARLHIYYVFLCQFDPETVKLLKDYHICHINDNSEVTVLSGSLYDLIWLIFQLNLAEDLSLRNIGHAFLNKYRDIFVDIPKAKDGTLIPWRPKS